MAAVCQMARTGTQIILDNGAHEGIMIDVDVYARLAHDVLPWAIVLPDVVGMPARQSRERCLAFTNKVADIGAQYIFVGQGNTASDALDGFDWAAGNLDPQRFIIGIGQAYLLWLNEQEKHQRHQTTHEIVRMDLVDEIMANVNAAKMRYHIFGARWTPWSHFTKYSNIASIDTIKPCYCALHNMIYPNCQMGTPHTNIRNSRICASETALIINVAAFCKAYDCVMPIPTPATSTQSIAVDQKPKEH
jgi:hypothetical protein